MPSSDNTDNTDSTENIDHGALVDRAAISDVVYAYATGLDRRDWHLFRSIFMDEIQMDFRSVGLKLGTYSAERWVSDAKRLFAGFKATQHTSTNHVYDLRGDEATCVSNMQAEHFVGCELDDGAASADERWTIGGYYINELVRTPAGWKLARVTLNVKWQTGNAEVSRIALRKGRAIEAEEGPT